MQGFLIPIRSLANPLEPGKVIGFYIVDDEDYRFSAEYGGDPYIGALWSTNLSMFAMLGVGGSSSSGGGDEGGGPRMHDPNHLLHPKGNGGNVKVGKSINPIQNYTKINVHNIEKNMCHLNFDNYPYPEDNPIDDLSTINNYLSYLWGLMDTPTFGVGLIGYLTKKNTIRIYTNAIFKGLRPFYGNGSTFAITFAKIGKYAGYASFYVGGFFEYILYIEDNQSLERMATDIGMMYISNKIGGWGELLLGFGYKMTMYEFQDSRILFDSFETLNKNRTMPNDKTKVRIIKRSKK